MSFSKFKKLDELIVGCPMWSTTDAKAGADFQLVVNVPSRGFVNLIATSVEDISANEPLEVVSVRDELVTNPITRVQQVEREIKVKPLR